MLELRVCCESGGLVWYYEVCIICTCIHFPKVYTEKKANPGAESRTSVLVGPMEAAYFGRVRMFECFCV